MNYYPNEDITYNPYTDNTKTRQYTDNKKRHIRNAVRKRHAKNKIAQESRRINRRTRNENQSR